LYRGKAYDYVVLATFYCKDCWWQTQAGLTITYPPCPMPKLLEDAKRERLEEEAAKLAADLEWERTKPEREAAKLAADLEWERTKPEREATAVKKEAARKAELKRITEPYDWEAALEKLSPEEKAENAVKMAAYMERERQRKERWDAAVEASAEKRRNPQPAPTSPEGVGALTIAEGVTTLTLETADEQAAAVVTAREKRRTDWWDAALEKVKKEWAAKESAEKST
jgi:hypothetical protein